MSLDQGMSTLPLYCCGFVGLGKVATGVGILLFQALVDSAVGGNLNTVRCPTHRLHVQQTVSAYQPVVEMIRADYPTAMDNAVYDILTSQQVCVCVTDVVVLTALGLAERVEMVSTRGYCRPDIAYELARPTRSTNYVVRLLWVPDTGIVAYSPNWFVITASNQSLVLSREPSWTPPAPLG